MRRPWFPPLLFLAPLLWLFRRALFSEEMFAFRDSAHFYFPLYKYVQERWRSGVPLWNPFDNIGQPLLGDPTAAVLYPGKLVFALPFDYAFCFVLYVVLHLWLAAYGAYFCARTFRATQNGALLCGLTYELSGQVLFQYCNPIFCVGAAWLPWALVCFERMIKPRIAGEGGERYVLLFAVVLSLMVLGGDPQIAYHVLLAVSLRLVFFRADVNCSLSRGVKLLVRSSVVALLLSAVQVLPSYAWASHSDRAVSDAPRSILEWTTQAFDQRDVPGIVSLCRKPDNDGHASRIYDFSVGPWRWCELFWPNITGPLFPVYGRWISALPGEDRTWTPSIYLGLLPILLATARGRLLGGASTLRWISWLTLLSVFAAMGNYGVGWLVNEVRFQMLGDNYEPSGWLPGFGGMYWFLTVTLPGYVSFRYPAKWWTIASFGIALLAAKGWPVLWSREIQFRRFGTLLFCTLLPTMIAAFFLIRSDAMPNHLFGPLRRDVAWHSVFQSVLHVGLVIVAIICFLRFGTRRRGIWLIGLLLVDLLVSQRNLVQTRPVAEWETLQHFASETVFRSPPRRAYPPAWERSSSSQRLAELKQSDAMTLMPKHHLVCDTRSIHSAVAMTSADYSAVWEVSREVESDPQVASLELLSALGAKHVLAPQDEYSLESEGFGSVPTNLVHYRNPKHYPRAWLVSNWESVATDSRLDRESLLERTRAVWLDDDTIRDLREVAYVESDGGLPNPSASPNPGVCKLVDEQPERLVVEVAVDCPSILVLCDQHAPGWKVRLLGENTLPRELLRVNRVMRGVYVEPGEHTIEFRYRPTSVIVGAIVSGLAWIAVVIAAGVAIVHQIKSDS